MHYHFITLTCSHCYGNTSITRKETLIEQLGKESPASGKAANLRKKLQMKKEISTKYHLV